MVSIYLKLQTMAQPIRKRKIVEKEDNIIHGTGDGIDYCDECPFLGYENGKVKCMPNDIVFKKKKNIPVPDNCGNKRK